MIFTGLAGHFSASWTLRHLFATGSSAHSLALRKELARRYAVDVSTSSSGQAQSRPGTLPLEQVQLYHSGRTALSVVLRALDLPAGSPVIIPGLTCIAVVRAIKSAGLQPVFCDITPDNLDYNCQKLEQIISAIDKNDKVCYNGIIIVQNTLGLAWDVKKIERLAQKYRFAIVEDLAHSAGRRYKDGREMGTVGQAVALSFGKGKAIDTTNGGAAILRTVESSRAAEPSSFEARSNDRPLSEARLGTTILPIPTTLPPLSTRLRDRFYPTLAGISRAFWSIGLGKPVLGTFVRLGWIKKSADTELDPTLRLTHWQAKLALGQLRNLPTAPLREFRLVDNRDKVLLELMRSGFNFSDVWYDSPVAPSRYYAEADFPTADCPETVRIAEHIINLPVNYPAERLARAYEIIERHALSPAHAKKAKSAKTPKESQNA